MALTISSTIGGEFSNSYVDVAFADDYFLDHYDSAKQGAWEALGELQKEVLLISACRVLETARFTNQVESEEFNLFYELATGKVRLGLPERASPVRYLTHQNLQFPRNLDVDQAGNLFIPESVKTAQCEQAVYLLSFDDSAMASRLQGIVNETLALGRGQLHFNQQFRGDGSAFAPLALEMIRPFLIKSGAKLRRG